MSEMSWQLRHPEYGLMRIDLEETTGREGWTGKYLDFKRSLFTSTVDGTSRKLSYTDTDDSAYSMEFLRGNSDDNAPCLLYTSPSPRDKRQSRMPSSA